MRYPLWLASVSVLVASLFSACTPGPAPEPATGTAVIVDVRTELGDFAIALYPEQAPGTVANFLRYVDAGHYDQGQFYRAVRLNNQAPSDVPIQVVQGGMGLSEDPAQEPVPPFPPIAHETTAITGLRHGDGAVSMARFDPGSASSEFFIAIGDNAPLDFGGGRNPDGQGYAVFGQVVEGRAVLDQLHQRCSDRDLPPHLQVVQGQILNEPVGFRISRRY